jgi:hypothetical protein
MAITGKKQEEEERERRVCAIDSTGLSIWRYVRWLWVRYDSSSSRRRREKRRKDFLKLHFVVDCRSLLILSFKVTSSFKADSRQVEELLRFIKDLGWLCADKAYLSRKICDLMIARHGGEPYISIKKNVVRIRAQGSKAWREMLVPVSKEQEAVQEEIPPEKSRRDHRLDGQEEIRSHALLEEEKRTEERNPLECLDIQPLHNSKTTPAMNNVPKPDCK